MKKYIVLVFAVLVGLTSCVRSLYPITENENEWVFKKELLGHWIDEDSTRYIVDTVSGKSKVYTVAIIEKKKHSDAHRFSDTSYFLTTLVRFHDRLFMDCFPDMGRFENRTVGESAVNCLLPIHIVIRITFIEQNSIGVASIDEGRFLSLINEKKFDVRHELINKDDILLTEDPLRLQQKLIDLEQFSSVFNNNRLTRLKNTTEF